MSRLALTPFLLMLALAAPAHGAERITIEDVLNAEDVDGGYSSAAFSPDGKMLAYTVHAAPTMRPTWGYGGVTSLQVATRVFVAAVGGDPREIVGAHDLVYSLAAIDRWSPDGGTLLLVASEHDGYRLATFDVPSGRVAPLPGRPSSSLLPTFAWAPDGRIAYTIVQDGARQQRHDAQVLNDLNTRWGATWSGRSVEVTVHSANPLFAQTAEKPGSLMLADPRTGAAQKIADGDFLWLAFSPSGRTLAAVVEREPAPDALGRGELSIFTLGAEGAKLAIHVPGIDVTGKPLWSPTGKSLLVIARQRDAKTKKTRLYVVDAASGVPRALATAGLTFEKPSPDIGSFPMGWLGETPVAIATREVEGADGPAMSDTRRIATYDYGQGRNLRADLFAFGGTKFENLTGFAKGQVREFVVAEGGLLTVTDGALWHLAPGKAAERLTAEGAPPVVGFGVDAGSPRPAVGTAYYRSSEVERVSLLALHDGEPKRTLFDLKTRTLTPLSVAGEIVASSPDLSTLLTRNENGWSSTLALDDGTPRTLVTVNAGLKDRAVAPIEKFTYAVGKRMLNGYVVWPPGARKNEKLPAVVYVYGGAVYGDQPPRFAKPGISTPYVTPVFSGQLLAAEGYAVIYPSMPLGAGADSDQPAQLAEAVVAAIDALATGGRIDAKRVGVMGQSYGGFSTAALLSKRSDRFQAGVSLAGLYDLFHAYGARPFTSVFSNETLGTTFGDIIESGQAQLGTPFWQGSDAYIRNSPIFHVETLDSPLLMLHGDLDIGATDLAGAERMYSALLRTGKKPVLVHYWGEGHVAQSAAAMRDQWSRITTWFGHYLKRAP